MALTQESVLSFLAAGGGKVKRSDLVGRFADSLDCADPDVKERNRELFRTLVNNVAFVREMDGARYVVLKKTYRRLLLAGVQTAESRETPSGSETTPLPGERQRPPARDGKTGSCGDAAGPGEEGEPGVSEAREAGAGTGNPEEESFSPIRLALQRSTSSDIRLKRMLHFDTHRDPGEVENPRTEGPGAVKGKPFGLPLRAPPSATGVESRELKVDAEGERPESPKPEYFTNEGRLPPVETGGGGGSPWLSRAARSAKDSEEPKDSRVPSTVPLEQSEHEWLVRCAAGHWGQVYGLLLRDSQLAERKDFMSGFTALHWAAKVGNSEILVKIIDISRKDGVDIDVNVRAHGGYTPLHIAALHDQEYIMAMLVGEYGANTSIRDNCGKRPCHYLRKDISGTLREMMGMPKAQEARGSVVHEREELDLFPDLSRSLHSISRLFQPAGTTHKKKYKQRSGFHSLGDDPGDAARPEASAARQRVTSDAFN